MKRKFWGICLVLGALAQGMATRAAAEIVVGQTIGVTGPVAEPARELTVGARLYFDAVNRAGGVHGEQIRLVTLDDQFVPAKTAENARLLIERDRAVALFLTRGTPHTEAVLPLLAEHRIAMVAPSTGAMVLHQPVNRYVFNVRSSYQREAEKAIELLHAMGSSRIAIVHVDDSFGRDALKGAQAGFARLGLAPVATVAADRMKPELDKIVPQVGASKAQAVVWIGSTDVVNRANSALLQAGHRLRFVTLSNNASNGLIKVMGAAGAGVIVTQVFPDERGYRVPFINEARELLKQTDSPDALSPVMVEGFAAAKVLVEALRRAGPKPGRAELLAALERMNDYDLGGMQVGYSRTDHSGLDFVDLSIISGGRFRR